MSSHLSSNSANTSYTYPVGNVNDSSKINNIDSRISPVSSVMEVKDNEAKDSVDLKSSDNNSPLYSIVYFDNLIQLSHSCDSGILKLFYGKCNCCGNKSGKISANSRIEDIEEGDYGSKNSGSEMFKTLLSEKKRKEEEEDGGKEGGVKRRKRRRMMVIASILNRKSVAAYGIVLGLISVTRCGDRNDKDEDDLNNRDSNDNGGKCKQERKTAKCNCTCKNKPYNENIEDKEAGGKSGEKNIDEKREERVIKKEKDQKEEEHISTGKADVTNEDAGEEPQVNKSFVKEDEDNNNVTVKNVCGEIESGFDDIKDTEESVVISSTVPKLLQKTDTNRETKEEEGLRSSKTSSSSASTGISTTNEVMDSSVPSASKAPCCGNVCTCCYYEIRVTWARVSEYKWNEINNNSVSSTSINNSCSGSFLTSTFTNVTGANEEIVSIAAAAASAPTINSSSGNSIPGKNINPNNSLGTGLVDKAINKSLVIGHLSNKSNVNKNCSLTPESLSALTSAPLPWLELPAAVAAVVNKANNSSSSSSININYNNGNNNSSGEILKKASLIGSSMCVAVDVSSIKVLPREIQLAKLNAYNNKGSNNFNNVANFGNTNNFNNNNINNINSNNNLNALKYGGDGTSNYNNYVSYGNNNNNNAYTNYNINNNNNNGYGNNFNYAACSGYVNNNNNNSINLNINNGLTTATSASSVVLAPSTSPCGEKNLQSGQVNYYQQQQQVQRYDQSVISTNHTLLQHQSEQQQVNIQQPTQQQYPALTYPSLTSDPYMVHYEFITKVQGGNLYNQLSPAQQIEYREYYDKVSRLSQQQ